MRKCVFVTVLLLAVMIGGCDETFLGFGAGVAGVETLQSWQENLEVKKAELQKQYDLVMAEIETAPDPNALKLAKEKLEPIQNARLANEVALHMVTESIKAIKTENPEDRKDAIGVGVISLGLIALEELKRRLLNKKYTAHKAGQAKLEQENPEAGKQLYSAIGYERRLRGL